MNSCWISWYPAGPLPGRTATKISTFGKCWRRWRNTARTCRLNLFLTLLPPYFRPTAIPSRDRSPDITRALTLGWTTSLPWWYRRSISSFLVNRYLRGRVCFNKNQAERTFRPFARRRARTDLPDLVPIRAKKPCLFLRFLLLLRFLTFISSS